MPGKLIDAGVEQIRSANEPPAESANGAGRKQIRDALLRIIVGGTERTQDVP